MVVKQEKDLKDNLEQQEDRSTMPEQEPQQEPQQQDDCLSDQADIPWLYIGIAGAAIIVYFAAGRLYGVSRALVSNLGSNPNKTTVKPTNTGLVVTIVNPATASPGTAQGTASNHNVLKPME